MVIMFPQALDILEHKLLTMDFSILRYESS
jgi:hypothetical protein